MKYIISKWATIAERLVITNIFMGAVFATIYYYINQAVTRGLIVKSMQSSRKNDTMSVDVMEFIKNDLRGRKLVTQVEKEGRTLSDHILIPIMDPDPWLHLEDRRTHNWMWWFLKSMLIQSGMGADMGNVSNKHNMFQIIQIVEVLLINVYMISL